MAYKGTMSIRLPLGLSKRPKFSSEQRMPPSICFWGLRTKEYILLIEPLADDATLSFTASRLKFHSYTLSCRATIEGIVVQL